MTEGVRQLCCSSSRTDGGSTDTHIYTGQCKYVRRKHTCWVSIRAVIIHWYQTIQHISLFIFCSQQSCGKKNNGKKNKQTIKYQSCHQTTVITENWPLQKWGRKVRVLDGPRCQSLCAQVCFVAWKQTDDKQILLILSDSLLLCVWIGPLCCRQLLTGLLAGTAAVMFTFPPDTLGCSETLAIIRSYVVRHPPLCLRG